MSSRLFYGIVVAGSSLGAAWASPDRVDDCANASGDARAVLAEDASAAGGAAGSAGDATFPEAAALDARPEAGSIPPCPTTPPTEKTNCVERPGACTYADCRTYGQIQASCGPTKQWTVVKLACGPVPCGLGGNECLVGEICKETAGGMLRVSCVKNTCAPGLVSCDCLDCGGGVLNELKLTCAACGLCP